MSFKEEDTPILVYTTNPMYLTGKHLIDDADSLTATTNMFWHHYQMVASNTVLPFPLQQALYAVMQICEESLSDSLTTRNTIGITLQSAATQVTDMDRALQNSFTVKVKPPL